MPLILLAPLLLLATMGSLCSVIPVQIASSMNHLATMQGLPIKHFNKIVLSFFAMEVADKGGSAPGGVGTHTCYDVGAYYSGKVAHKFRIVQRRTCHVASHWNP